MCPEMLVQYTLPFDGAIANEPEYSEVRAIPSVVFFKVRLIRCSCSYSAGTHSQDFIGSSAPEHMYQLQRQEAASCSISRLLTLQDGAVKEIMAPIMRDFCVAGQPPGPKVLSQAHQLMRDAALRVIAS